MNRWHFWELAVWLACGGCCICSTCFLEQHLRSWGFTCPIFCKEPGMLPSQVSRRLWALALLSCHLPLCLHVQGWAGQGCDSWASPTTHHTHWKLVRSLKIVCAFFFKFAQVLVKILFINTSAYFSCNWIKMSVFSEWEGRVLFLTRWLSDFIYF